MPLATARRNDSGILNVRSADSVDAWFYSAVDSSRPRHGHSDPDPVSKYDPNLGLTSASSWKIPEKLPAIEGKWGTNTYTEERRQPLTFPNHSYS